MSYATVSNRNSPPSTDFTGKSATFTWTDTPSGACDTFTVSAINLVIYLPCGTHQVTATGFTVHTLYDFVIYANLAGYRGQATSGTFYVVDVSTSSWAKEYDTFTFTYAPGGLFPPPCNGASISYSQSASMPGDVVFSTSANQPTFIQTSLTNQFVYCDFTQANILGIRHWHQDLLVYDDTHPFTSSNQWLGGYAVQPTDASISVAGTVAFSVTAGLKYEAGSVGISASTNGGIFSLQAQPTTRAAALQPDGSLKLGYIDVEWNPAYQRPTVNAAYDITVFASAAGFLFDKVRFVVQNQYTMGRAACVLPNTFCTWNAVAYITNPITLGDGFTPYQYASAGSYDTMCDVQAGTESMMPGSTFPAW
jgi:hypothetical protein